MKVADAAVIAGVIAQEFIELIERHRAALHVAIRARLLEELDQLVARHRRLGADRPQHALVGEFDHGVAEVEEEPGVFHWATSGRHQTSARRSLRYTRWKGRARGMCGCRRDRSRRRPRGVRSSSTANLPSRTFAAP